MSEPIKVKGMGLLTGLSLAGTLIQAGEFTKLKALEEQGQREEFEKLFRSYLRDAIFRLKTNAEDAISEKSSNPKYSATILKILSAKLSDSVVKVEFFEDLSDKEYASNVIKLISKNESEISAQLSSTDERDVQEAIKQYGNWSDLKYYVNSSNALDSYWKAQSMSKNSSGTLISYLLLALALIVSLFAFRAMSRMEVVLPCLAFILLIVSLVVLLAVNGSKKKAKKNVEEFKSLYDEEKLLKINNTYHSSIDEVKAKMKDIEEVIVQLLGKMPVLD
jgi:cytochrome c oxidase subunit IV